jgi:hypothetical protein
MVRHASRWTVGINGTAGVWYFCVMDPERGTFYLGRSVDSDQPLTYEAADLTTHGVIVGMTGSGKTGLGVGLIEEALLSGIPCLVIDPKGDMGNLALTFPSLEASDFEPWMDEGEATRSGRTTAEMARETAALWSKGLEGHGISRDRLARLSDEAEVTIYTPGSSSGIGLDVLGSMNAPDLDWDTESEVIREEIQSLVSSVLALAKVASDPVSGPEHILLSTIVETMWRQGNDLDLAGLVGQVPHPPFRKLGVFDVDTFIPEKDRMSLAMRLNGLLASPSFAAWMEGTPLDIEKMLRGGPKTNAAVIYLAHLSDDERQFMVTLLLSKMVTWIRSQPGTSQLKALIYMDEVFGFAPPTANPPSKTPILTIFKQARAHGVGMVLSTQNPVDIDYKAMSNAGTWMIGRLQTENDKRRIVEGLSSASGTVDIKEISNLISDLEKRQFVLHSTKNAHPKLFGTRWAMSYLAGPLTRGQVAELMSGSAARALSSNPEPLAASPTPTTTPMESARDTDVVPVQPPMATGYKSVFLDPSAPWAAQVGAHPTGTTFEAAGVAVASLTYNNAAAGINHQEVFEAILYPLDGILDKHEVLVVDHDDRDFHDEMPPGAKFRLPDVDIANRSFWTGLGQDLTNYLVAHQPLRILRNSELKLYSRVDETPESFRKRCREAADNAADVEVAKLRDRFKTRIDRVQTQIRETETRFRTAEREVSSMRQQEVVTGVGDLLGQFLGGRSRANPLGQAANRRAATQRAGSRVDAEATKLTARQQELADLEDDLATAIIEIGEAHDHKAEAIEEVDMAVAKSNVRITDLKLVWIPVA